MLLACLKDYFTDWLLQSPQPKQPEMLELHNMKLLVLSKFLLSSYLNPIQVNVYHYLWYSNHPRYSMKESKERVPISRLPELSEYQLSRIYKIPKNSLFNEKQQGKTEKECFELNSRMLLKVKDQ